MEGKGRKGEAGVGNGTEWGTGKMGWEEGRDGRVKDGEWREGEGVREGQKTIPPPFLNHYKPCPLQSNILRTFLHRTVLIKSPIMLQTVVCRQS